MFPHMLARSRILSTHRSLLRTTSFSFPLFSQNSRPVILPARKMATNVQNLSTARMGTDGVGKSEDFPGNSNGTSKGDEVMAMPEMREQQPSAVEDEEAGDPRLAGSDADVGLGDSQTMNDVVGELDESQAKTDAGGLGDSKTRTDAEQDSGASSLGKRQTSQSPANEGIWFRVSDSVQLALHLGDLTEWFVDGETDAIVNAANTRMLGGGGVDGAIHSKAGPELKEACKKVPEVERGVRCPTGEARVTGGFKLPASRVIHTVGPIYYRDAHPEALLHDSYRNSLTLAAESGIKYVAFPAISCGVYAYPPREAATIAMKAIKKFSHKLSQVHFVLFHQPLHDVWQAEAEKQFTKLERVEGSAKTTKTRDRNCTLS